MEIKVKGKEVVIKHILKRGQTYRIQKGESIESVSFLNKTQIVSGFSNVTEGGLGIVCLDYDNCEFSVPLEDVNFLQKKFRLPPFYAFKTGKGYHLINLRVLSHGKIHEILEYSRTDDNYKTLPLRSPHRSYILRISPKKGGRRPKFIGMVGKHKNLAYKVSEAHLKLLEKLYPTLAKIKYFEMDGGKKLKLQLYETR